MRYIVCNPEIFDGEPVIVGTRIPAVRLQALLKYGYTEEKLRQEFPHVGVRKLRGALSELIGDGIQHRLEQPARA